MSATVWRVVYDLPGLTMRSDWSVHHDSIREWADQFSRDMPGTDVRIESADVTGVEVASTQSVKTNPDDFDAEADPEETFIESDVDDFRGAMGVSDE